MLIGSRVEDHMLGRIMLTSVKHTFPTTVEIIRSREPLPLQLLRSNVRYSPGLTKYLLSLNLLFYDGFKSWDENGATLIKDTTVLRFKPHHGLFILRPHEEQVNNACDFCKTMPTLVQWNLRMAHTLGPSSKLLEMASCETCEIAKARRMSYKNTHPYRTQVPLEHVHNDKGRPGVPPTYGGEPFYELFVDEAS
ncbi:Aste57867_5465 [Aphanomyces stellatus]|uniref:Aste57867_5465 protein n=1 Tax=Aphanomyces stellatus TaxID=120398 RepID=A0A485KH12_9STRA|nr:hypothetical protein As57867_005452 [Aphanomyces stellatus]VFT82517.1 Aste57867_5465 [Aphanomyces stellatus]